ncbi:Longitudinals lacking protein [Armadillidium nasatum]|uniref:Longitudinals lacking protein n=1 Tax=Armadillidium nasatum TaxID=96803 RepID=A0A5N5SIU7_9CRUS|nr:Longitudinals lacking protein [Armadillidium nasatum]
MEELLSLKWNNHRSTFLHILSILRDKQLYTDATLACDGKFYNVHRLVLSTCSDYFSAMFDRTTCKNPIIVLKDIKCEDLEALLDYMYLGEVNVRQADLASLIKAAECLRVKGLAVPDDEPPQKRGRGDTSNLRRSDGGSPPSKRKRRDEGQDGREDIRPSGGSGSSRPKTPQSHSRLSPIPPPESGSDPNSSPNNHLHQPPLDSTQSMDGDAPKVKLEMEDTGGGDDIGGDHGFNIQNESFKEEGNEDPVGDLSSDLPEFLQQSSDGTYPHSFPGPSFQPDLQNWQGDQVLSSNNFSGMGFSSQTQEGSQNTSGSCNYIISEFE